jgi:hypothetical protein
MCRLQAFPSIRGCDVVPLCNGDSYTAEFLKFELGAATASTLEARACRHRAAHVDEAPRKQPSRQNLKVWEFAPAGCAIYNDAADWNPAT